MSEIQVVYIRCNDCSDPLLTLDRASEVSGYSRSHLYRLIYTQKVKAERLGRSWLIHRTSLLNYKAKPKQRGIKQAYPVGGASRYTPVSELYLTV